MPSEAQKEIEELRRVEHALQRYEARKVELKVQYDENVHGSIVGPLIEQPVSDYFSDVVPGGMLIGEGFPVLFEDGDPMSAQIDLVIDFDGAQWHKTRRASSHHGDEPLYGVAMEVRYRGHYLRDKGPKAVAAEVMDIVKRLQGIVDRNVRAGRKCWSSAVLVGPGFSMDPPNPGHEAEDSACGLIDPYLKEVLHRLARYYGDHDLTPSSLAEIPSSRPFVDAIALPGLLLKKHTLFENANLGASQHPVMLAQPAAATDPVRLIRPLAVLKGHLRHVLRCIVGQADFDNPAWREEESPRFLGPTPREEDVLNLLRLAVLDGFTGSLFHAGHDGSTVRWSEHHTDPDGGEPVRIPDFLLRRIRTLRSLDGGFGGRRG